MSNPKQKSSRTKYMVHLKRGRNWNQSSCWFESILSYLDDEYLRITQGESIESGEYKVYKQQCVCFEKMFEFMLTMLNINHIKEFNFKDGLRNYCNNLFKDSPCNEK